MPGSRAGSNRAEPPRRARQTAEPSRLGSLIPALAVDRKPRVGGGGDVSLGELVLHSLIEPRWKLLQHVQDGWWLDGELQLGNEVEDASTSIYSWNPCCRQFLGRRVAQSDACTCAWGETCNGMAAIARGGWGRCARVVSACACALGGGIRHGQVAANATWRREVEEKTKPSEGEAVYTWAHWKREAIFVACAWSTRTQLPPKSPTVGSCS